MKIALAQTNSTVGDLCGNAQRILSFVRRAAESDAHVVAFPELALVGYPPRDLLEKQRFLDDTEQLLAQLASYTAILGLTLIFRTFTHTGYSYRIPIDNSAVFLKH